MFDGDINANILELVHSRTYTMWVGIDRYFRIVYVNEAFCQHCRKTQAALSGQSLLDVFYGGRKYDINGCYHGPLIETMDTGRELQDVETCLRGAPGNTNWWHLASTYLIRNSAGEPVYTFGSYLPIDRFKTVERRFDKLKTSIIMSVAKIIGARDAYTMHHSEHVGDLMGGLAEFMNLPPDEITQAYLAGVIHDVGKIRIPEQILNKQDKLTIAEIAVIKKHPEMGAEIIRTIDGFENMAAIVRSHHERFDGSGYPDSLVGEDIPFISRMLAVCDSFDAMTTARCYRQPIKINEALQEIVRCAGTQFDPRVAAAFVRYASQYEKQ